jgi:hypothetical protein
VSAVLYLYGFVPLDAGPFERAPVGLDDQAVTLLELGGFAAAVSSLDSEVYGEGRLEARLKDLAWVGARGVRHETVVTWFADHTTIVPSRLFTLYTSPEALRGEAASRSEVIAEGLRRFRDVREWDLKVSYDRARVVEHLSEMSEEAAAQEAEIGNASPGKRYLLERKREADLTRQTIAAVRRVAEELLGDLSELAEDVRALDVPAGEEGELPVVLAAALLVKRDRAERLEALANPARESLGRRGVHVSLTGPWAPYRFIGGDDA